MKKTAKLFVVLALAIIFSIFLTVTGKAETCPGLKPGDLFKVPAISSVYLINANMERLYFFNSEIFHSWYNDYSGVKEIPAVCTDQYSAGGAVSYRPGSKLVKTVISPTVYAVLPGGELKKISDENAAVKLYGSNWAKLVRDIPDVYYSTYKVKAEAISDTPHDGMLVKETGTSDIYEVKNSQMYRVGGNIDSTLTSDVRSVSREVFENLDKSSKEVSPLSIIYNPSQQDILPITSGQSTDVEQSLGEGPLFCPKFSNDGRHIIFQKYKQEEKNGLYLVGYDEDENKITPPLQIVHDNLLVSCFYWWSPDNTKIVYVAMKDIYYPGEKYPNTRPVLKLIDLTNLTISELSGTLDTFFNARWVDNNSLVYVAKVGLNDPEQYFKVFTDGSVLRPTVSDPLIAFSHYRNNTLTEGMVSTINWQNVTKYLLPTNENGAFARISPDGAKVAYIAMVGAKQEVRIVDIDGANEKTLGNGGQPVWSFDSSKVAYGTEVFKGFYLDSSDIYSADPLTAVKTKIVSSHSVKGPAINPSWHPNGKIIVFEYYKNDNGIMAIKKLNN